MYIMLKIYTVHILYIDQRKQAITNISSMANTVIGNSKKVQ